jgi:methylmalonyl-CoA mutase
VCSSDLAAAVRADEYTYEVRGRELRGPNYTESLSRNRIPKIVAPSFRDWGETLRFLMLENLPGAYPYTAGVYPYRREEEDPIRMFAGEGSPERTNRRFHYLARGQKFARLSTAFDSTPRAPMPSRQAYLMFRVTSFAHRALISAASPLTPRDES